MISQEEYNKLLASNKELLEENERLKSGMVRRMEISIQVELDNNELKKEIEKIKGEKKKEYQRAQKLVTQLQQSQQMNERLVELVRNLEPIMIAWSATTSHGLPIHKQHQEVLDRIKSLLQSTTQEKGETG